MAFPNSLKPAMASIIAAALMLVLINVQLVRGTRTGVNHTSSPSPTSSAGDATITGLSSGFWAYQSYNSSPFNPPKLQITRNGQPLAPGLLFLSPENVTPLGAAKDVAPLIMTDDGELVWNGPKLNATDFRATTYQGAPILIFWSGIRTVGVNIGHGYGNVTFLDTSYHTILTVCPKFGLVTPDNSWQHHARPFLITPDSFTLTYFNDRSAYPVVNGTHLSNGLKLLLPLPPSKSAHPKALAYLSDPAQPISAGSEGSSTTLVDGNIFLDYGRIAVMKEYGPHDPSGSDVRWTARFGADNLVQSYRGFKAEWHGRPTTSPSLVVIASSNGSAAGYVSWNGATDVEGWKVSEGHSAGELSFVRNLGHGGFETQFEVAQRCVQVAAIVGGVQGAKSNVACS
ncbi:MAG: hypothetical protein OHK93_000063 [Ramalina farinacea]|uniref:Uncharacterized protein n=1 Tax=Ramalina farinacea TaxID=258253 RepID=A0AA43QG17_9LECA|nr:hypothetical protein [Ramalina farinacea]